MGKTNRFLTMFAISMMAFLGTAQTSIASPEGKWFEKAIAGNRIAQRHIAEGFEHGFNGFPKSLIFARRWYAIAASNGDKSATASLKRIDALMKNNSLVFARSKHAVNKSNFHEIRSTLGDSNAFSIEFEKDLFEDELDGYLLVDSAASAAADGAYLPRYKNVNGTPLASDIPIRRN